MGTGPIQRIRVSLGERSHEIWVGSKVLARRAPSVPRGREKRAFVIRDRALVAVGREVVRAFHAAKWEVHSLSVSAGEGLKDFKAVYPLYGELLRLGADRNSVIVAVGGGSVGDAVGFLAATYLRGVAWINVPTTLLAQVDSAIGGKTGINHEVGKNLIGAFHQPSLVVCDTSFIRKLPRRERISGLGEIAKYAITYDPAFFRFLEKNWRGVLSSDGALAVNAVAKCAALKGRVVAKDERDRKGVREVLNFGHTIGHALEGGARYGTFRHGEAVIWGMRAELAISEIRGYLSASERERIDGFLARLGAPPIPARLTAEAILERVRFDKKKVGEKVRFVLSRGLGKTVLDSGVSRGDVTSALKTVGII